ncbi:MAG TPA: EscU/YscU/HrcU family type III secretion system export apparatus switch protein [Gemmatimonadales bacterium]|nr:EscU/YscU/HrcU family type III secretion system export apparatus switch protein [Gemmatimonadales bacterium]
MAEDTAQERTEQPTTRRLERARTDGQVPRSQELLVAVVLLAGSGALVAFSGGLGRQATGLMRGLADWLPAAPFVEADATALLRLVIQGGLLAILPILLLLVVPIVVVGGVQARGVLSAKPITPDLSRLSPLKGLKRLLGVEGWFTLVKALLKLVVLGLITWGALRAMWPTIAGLVGADAGPVLEVTRTTSLRIALLAGLTFLALAIVDYSFVAWRHQQQMMMTRQEVVQEHRESEGDPLLKSRMRSLAQALTRRRMLQRVREADVVIVNPTHVAVAIKYDVAEASAPIVLAMGQRKLAERIRALAAESRIPVVRNVPVARALLASATVGRPIPPALYAAVAEILAFVYRQRGRLPVGLGGEARA